MTRPTWLVRIVILGVAGLYTLGLFVSGATLQPWINQSLAALPVIGSLLLLLWDVLIWKIPFVQTLTKRPYIAGFWGVTYRPTAESHIPDGGNRGPIVGYLIIRQSYWSLSVRSYTAESKSDSRSVFWERRPGSDFETPAFIYENLPKESESHRSTRHLGANRLDPTCASPTEMEGTYFTDRYTKGDMAIELINRTKGYGSFKAADDAARRVSVQ
ncbi:hypothetical protein [Plantibacter flavus]|uniref:Cap15 family cyclic dinucleotide receptor domain-containing protein n=1 Tax=Plantibacter flavus TaxID=150123 RepID=UPI001376269B